MPNEDVVSCYATDLQFKDFTKFAHELQEQYSYNCGAVKVIPPQEMLSNHHVLSNNLLGNATPLLQAYEKKLRVCTSVQT